MSDAAIDSFIASFVSACRDLPLYGSVAVPDEAEQPVERLFRSDLQFDCYCVLCEKPSHFKLARKLAVESGLDVSSPQFPNQSLNTFKARFRCTRSDDHVYTYFWHFFPKQITKVGQSPALETIAGNDVEGYRKVLGGQYFAELHRATGLASHGIGIGSFVYLRRIFERLIYNHRDEAVAAGVALEGFDSLRMSEKIEALRADLPDTVFKFRAAYGILSKGIHELSEAECKEYFPILRAAIIAILEQDLQKRRKREAEAELEKQMAKIAKSMGGST